MTNAIALISLIIISVMVSFGNYWFTYGLWPKSWVSLFLFWFLSTVVTMAITAVMKENK